MSTRTMKALVLHGYNDMRITARDIPEVSSGDVLVHVSEVGICGSDIHGYTGENGRRFPGQIMGHEAAGTVAADPSGTYEPGEAVTFNPLIACGDCGPCTAGEEQHCPQREVIGVQADRQAAFAEFVVVPVRNIHRLPDGVDTQEGALIEPLAVAVHAVRRARVSADDRVLIIGGGPVGQSLILALQDLGVRHILISELDSGRRDLCATLGAEPVDPSAGDLGDSVTHAVGQLADVVLDAVGISATLSAALAASADGGRVLLVGMGSATIEMPAFAVSTREREVIGSFCYSVSDFTRAVDIAGRNSRGLSAMISSVIPPAGAPAMFEELGSGRMPAGKVLVQFSSAGSPAQ